jgi:hypothetical protein
MAARHFGGSFFVLPLTKLFQLKRVKSSSHETATAAMWQPHTESSGNSTTARPLRAGLCQDHRLASEKT